MVKIISDYLQERKGKGRSELEFHKDQCWGRYHRGEVEVKEDIVGYVAHVISDYLQERKLWIGETEGEFRKDRCWRLEYGTSCTTACSGWN